jgi:hypothetical protein
MTMKMKSTLVAATLVAFATVSGAAYAVDDSAVVVKPATPDTAKTAQSVQQPPAVKKTKPHSHVQEKSGVSPTVTPPPTPEEKAAMDKMHQHQKDAK